MWQKFEKTADLSFTNFADLRFRIFADFTSTILFFSKNLNYANMSFGQFITYHKMWQKFEKTADLSFTNFADLRFRIFADFTSTIPFF